MRVPVFSRQKVVDENGHYTTTQQIFHDQFFQQAQQALSDEGGFQIPHMAAADIEQIKEQVPNGTHFYDTTNETPVVKKNGVFVAYP